MNILHVIPSTDPRSGGPIAGLRQICAHYADFQVTAEIACCDAKGDQWLHHGGTPETHALGPSRGNYRFSPSLLPWLRGNAHRFDAVVVEGIWQYHSYAVRKALVGTNVPYFVFTHGMLDPWFKRTYPLKHLKKWLYWPWADYRVLRDAKAVVFTCEEERLLARQSFWLYRANESVASYGTSGPPAGVDTTGHKFLSAHPELGGKRIVLFLGRLHPKKGCDLMIEAFARVASLDQRLHLVMAGPDEAAWASTLRALAKTLGVEDRITWPGMLEGASKWEAMYAAQVFCLPSHQENFGIVVAEALACAKPVLISNKVNIWREIEKDGAGFVDDDTVDGTVRNLQRWLAMNPDGTAQMAQRAQRCFARRFHIRRATERLIDIFREHRN